MTTSMYKIKVHVIKSVNYALLVVTLKRNLSSSMFFSPTLLHYTALGIPGRMLLRAKSTFQKNLAC